MREELVRQSANQQRLLLAATTLQVSLISRQLVSGVPVALQRFISNPNVMKTENLTGYNTNVPTASVSAIQRRKLCKPVSVFPNKCKKTVVSQSAAVNKTGYENMDLK